MSKKAITAAELELAGALVPRLRNRRSRNMKVLRKEDFERYAQNAEAPKPVLGEVDSIDIALMVGLDALAVKPGWGTCKTEDCGLVYELVEPWLGAKIPKTCPACRIKSRGECAEKCGKPATHGPHCWGHRQTVCAGPDENVDCPERRSPVKGAFAPSVIAMRHGQPWRCPKCGHQFAGKQKRLARMQKCAGPRDGVPCPDAAVGDSNRQCPAWSRKRGGRPWVCPGCAGARRSKAGVECYATGCTEMVSKRTASMSRRTSRPVFCRKHMGLGRRLAQERQNHKDRSGRPLPRRRGRA